MERTLRKKGKMTKHVAMLILTIYLAMAGLQTWAITDVLEARTLQDLYRSLNSPMQLKRWKAENGDPCEETWMGVQCSGSSLIILDLHGLELTGNLSIKLSNFKRLKHLDLGSNNIQGSISYSLPPNVTHLILANNKFSGPMPYSIGKMKHLRHLNLSHNLLSGSLVDMFYGLQNLKRMDLSFNYFTGTLPISFLFLTNLIGLFLQNNQFTGSVIFLANLSLTDLNIEDNYFSGLIPESFQNIINLRTAGNMFVTETTYGPWNFPINTIPRQKDIIISRTSAATLVTMESHTSPSIVHKKRKPALKIVMLIVAITLAASFSLAILFSQRKRHVRKRRSSVNPDDPLSPDESMRSQSPDSNLGHTSTSGESSPNTSSSFSIPLSISSSPPPISTSSYFTGIITIEKRKGFSRGGVQRDPIVYSTEELQRATNSFTQTNYIGERSLGHVYKAEFADGTVVAVKNIKIASKIFRNRPFLDVIKTIFSLEHPNIVRLCGYSIDQDLLVYEFSQNFSLYEALHGDPPKPLTYRERLQIALGVAQALDYMHSSYEPPISYGTLESANILFDKKLEPLLGDCDLAIFSTLVSPGNTKADVYTFGELFLELLTGRKSFDSARPQEQNLVMWVSSKLRDCISFENMIDPDIIEEIRFSWLCDIADIVSTCVQPNPDSRTSMRAVVDSLRDLLERQNVELDTGVQFLLVHSNMPPIILAMSVSLRVHSGGECIKDLLQRVYAVKELRNSLLERTSDEIVEEMSKLQLWRHSNLVSMIGHCMHEGKIYIVSDLVPSKSLASLLYDDPMHLAPLEWSARMSIALQVARGLEFMHQNDVLVRNLSALTVFVGDRLRVLIADVWIPRMFYMPSESYLIEADPYSSTHGYTPPEVSFFDVSWSKERDVYSFGILLLVLITGEKAYDDDYPLHKEPLINRVRHVLEGGDPFEVYALPDNNITAGIRDVESAVDLAYKCTLEDVSKRPKMSDVVDRLQDLPCFEV